MPRIWRPASLVVVTALLLIVTSVPLRAIGPAILMFYGGDLKEPVLVFPGNPSYNPTSFIWNPANGGVPYASEKRGTLPPNLEGRRYMSVAIFWGRFRPGHPEAIGREPAWPDLPAHRNGARRDCYHGAGMVNSKDLTANPEPVPVPTSLDEFIAGWTLTLDIEQWIRAQTEHAAK